MTSKVSIGSYASVKPSAITWNSSVSSLSDQAKITLPAVMMIRSGKDQYERVQTGMKFQEGMPVEISAGYDGTNDKRFKGFISRINYEVPLVLECEGYSYQLRKKVGFTRSYKDTTVKRILEDLVQGTDIRLSDAIPEIKLKKATFDNQTGIQVLEWFTTKCLLTTYFVYDTLYVGLEQVKPATTARFRLGWNVIKDGELQFQQTQAAEVRIEVESRKADGTKLIVSEGSAGVPAKKVTSVLEDAAALKRIAAEERKKAMSGAYGGSLSTFLKPYVTPGMAVAIEDAQYPDRAGTYFVTGVEGEFSSKGGRQKIKIGNRL